MSIKLFCINEDYWFAAKSEEEATQCARAEWSDDEIEIESCIEMGDEFLDLYRYEDDDGTEQTFREQLQKLIDEEQKFPLMFAMRE